jgi:type II secretory pathway pseudopilin PulG
MNRTFSTSSRLRGRRRLRGLTLVEVVAGLALLSTLLVAVLMTKTRVTRQWAHAQRKLQATAAADRLLSGWWQDVPRFPRHASGAVPGDAGLAWRTTPVSNPTAAALRASVVRLEVLDDREVLTSVEIVLDDDPPPGGAGVTR